MQPLLISHVNDLPDKHRQRLEASWAGAFYREYFCRLKEEPFAVLYADIPSRPNTAVNVLVGLETLKAGFGWSDEELYDHFIFDVQVRYALGLRNLKEGDFELRTLYNFRQRLSRYNQEYGTNLLVRAFEDITDQQLSTFKVQTGMQRMDSTQVASNIFDASRLQLAVEAVQRLARLMSETEQRQLAERILPYTKGDAGQYVYRVKGKEATAEHLQRVGETLYHLLQVLGTNNAQEPIYQVVQRFFDENFRVIESEMVQARERNELGSGSLQSLDDLEASYRQKANRFYKGYVATITETCASENPLQLITQVEVAPNNVEDADLLIKTLPELKERTQVQILYTDGGFGSPEADIHLLDQQVELIQTGIRGNTPDADKFSLADFIFETDQQGKPLTITCPNQQQVPVQAGRTTGYVVRFDPALCHRCPFGLHQRCPAVPKKRNQSFKLNFTQARVNHARRRQRYYQAKLLEKNPRAAIEATIWSVKHPYPNGKLPVRGKFRVTCMLIAAASMTNIRRIMQYRNSREAISTQA